MERILDAIAVADVKFNLNKIHISSHWKITAKEIFNVNCSFFSQPTSRHNGRTEHVRFFFFFFIIIKYSRKKKKCVHSVRVLLLFATIFWPRLSVRTFACRDKCIVSMRFTIAQTPYRSVYLFWFSFFSLLLFATMRCKLCRLLSIYDFLSRSYGIRNKHNDTKIVGDDRAPIEFYLHDFDCIIYGLLRRQSKIE